MFGDEHLGRAVALRREFRGMTQVALARALGVNKATMNGYEKGSRGMDDSTIDRISSILECEPIEIWEDGFRIFRYNHFRERAERMGIAVDELVDRMHPRPSLDQVREAFHAVGDKLWELLAGILKLVRPDRDSESRTGVPFWGVLVEPQTAKRERALRFRRGKKGRPKARLRSSGE